MADPRTRIENLLDQPTKIPVRGIITSTLIDSSNVQLILPARIRDENKKDFVFVHRSHITIREYVYQGPDYSGRLETILTKTDFDSSITTAGVLGDVDLRWRSLRADEDARTFTVDNRSKAMRVLSSNARSSHSSSNGDTSSRSSPSSVACRVAPQVLILVLRRALRDTICLLYCSQDPQATPSDVVSFQRPMPQDAEDRPALRLGAHLAVERLGRAVAVAAHEGRFIIYRIKATSDWSRDAQGTKLESAEEFEPFTEELQVDVNGAILKMDFLASDPSDPETVILLLVVKFNQSQTQFQRWDWDTRKTLSDGVRQEWSGFPLEDRLAPRLLIPAGDEPAFFLVTDTRVARFQNVLHGAPQPTEYGLPTIDHNHGRVAHRGSSKDKPHWIAWARPLRRLDFYETQDHFYLCREDAFLYLEFEKGSDVNQLSEIKRGKMNDTAFALIDMQLRYQAELVVTVGGLFAVTAPGEAERAQIFDDWSPLHDFSVRSDLNSLVVSNVPNQLSFLSTAVEAKAEVSVTKCSSLARTWALPCCDGELIGLVSSSSSGTDVQIVSSDDEATSRAAAELQAAIDMNAETVLASRLANGITVQVTTRSVRACPTSGLAAVSDLGGLASAAAIDDQFGQMLVFMKDAHGALLRYFSTYREGDEAHIGPDSQPPFHTKRLSSSIDSISCIAIHATDDSSVFAVVSTFDQGLLFVEATRSGNFSIIKELESDIPCESISIANHGDLLVIACGLRDGRVTFIEFEPNSRQITPSCTASIGTGPVQLFHSSDGVLALCDRTLRRLDRGLSQRKVFTDPVQFQVTHSHYRLRVWEQGQWRRSDLGTEQPLAQTEPETDVSEILSLPAWMESPCMVFISSSRAYIAQLEQRRVFAQQHSIFESDGPQCEITHTLPWDKTAIIAYKHINLIEQNRGATSNGNYRGRRQVFARLAIVQSKTNRKPVVKLDTLVHKRSGEAVQDMFEWNATISGSRYRLLVVRTTHPRKIGNDPPGGCLYAYTLSQDAEGTVQLQKRTAIKYETAMNSARPLSDDSLLIYYQGNLVIKTLVKKEGNKFEWTEKIFRRESPHSPVNALEVARSPAGKNMVHMVNNQQVILVDAESEKRWESENHNMKPQLQVLESNGVPIIIALTQEGVMGFSYNDRTSGEDSRPRYQSDSLWPMFNVKLQSTIDQIAPHTDGWYIGGSPQGSFYQMKVLSEDEWLLLRYLQNLTEQDRTICPFTWRDGLDMEGAPHRPLDPRFMKQKLKRASMHINCDMLRRLTVQRLRDHIIPSARKHRSDTNLDTVQERVELLQLLAKAVSPDLVVEPLYGNLLDWIRTFWQPRV